MEFLTSLPFLFFFFCINLHLQVVGNQRRLRLGPPRAIRTIADETARFRPTRAARMASGRERRCTAVATSATRQVVGTFPITAWSIIHASPTSPSSTTPVGSNTSVMLRQKHVRTEISGVEADLRWGHVSCSAPSLFYEPAAFQTAARGQDGRGQSSTPHPGAGR